MERPPASCRATARSIGCACPGSTPPRALRLSSAVQNTDTGGWRCWPSSTRRRPGGCSGISPGRSPTSRWSTAPATYRRPCAPPSTARGCEGGMGPAQSPVDCAPRAKGFMFPRRKGEHSVNQPLFGGLVHRGELMRLLLAGRHERGRHVLSSARGASPLVGCCGRLRLLKERQALHRESVTEEVVHLPTQVFGEEKPRVAEQQGRLADQIFRELPGTPQEFVTREHFSDESQSHRFGRVECLSGQQKVAPAVHSQQKRVNDVHAVAWHDVRCEMRGILELRGVGSKADVAQQGDLGVPPHLAVDVVN